MNFPNFTSGIDLIILTSVSNKNYYEVPIIRVELNSGRRGKNLKNQLTCSIK